MPTTRKKVTKTVYNENDSEPDGDFNDSGSDAVISSASSSNEEEEQNSSADEFKNTKKQRRYHSKVQTPRVKPHFTKSLLATIQKQSDNTENDEEAPLISVKDLTDADKLLPLLNLSESDSSDDEGPKIKTEKKTPKTMFSQIEDSDSESTKVEYKDVFSNLQDDSEEVARKTFLELEKHKNKIEEAKTSIQNYCIENCKKESNVEDLLALGGDVLPEEPVKTKKKTRKVKEDSESDMEDWEEVNESKLPTKDGIELFVDIPGACCRKSKKTLDVEMMMKRKMNRVKKEQQLIIHKVHVLCWLGHGNFVSGVLNDQDILSAALSMVPSKECYPGQRVDMKYLEQITSWYHDKVILKQDRHENKFRTKAPPLKNILLEQIKKKVFSTKKYIVYVFVSMLRSLGLQCRVMFNFVTVPIRPPNSELYSLSTKDKTENDKNEGDGNKTDKKGVKKESKKIKIPQLDGIYDESSSDSSDEMANITQLDGNDDVSPVKRRNTRSQKNIENKDVSPPKRARRNKEMEKPKEEPAEKPKRNVRKKKDQTEANEPPKIVVTNDENVSSQYFETAKPTVEITKRKRTRTTGAAKVQETKPRTKSAPGTSNTSKYFDENVKTRSRKKDDNQRVSHRDLKKEIPKAKNDVTDDLVHILKSRVKEAKEQTKRLKVKGKVKEESEDSDYLTVESPKRRRSNSSDEFKPSKISPKPGTSRKVDRRVFSTDDEIPQDKINVWCEVFVEELEQWVAVDVVRGKVHCVNEIYSKSTHPLTYAVGWDNNNYLKDLTRRYVPQWNTVTRKQRADNVWWNTAIKPWLGPKTARDREEDERLDQMQLEAPLPKVISEYKNHPLYALQRHLLKFEALYPPDAAVLGFVRKEPVYARECVYVCRSRDTWLKEAKVVKMGEKPYKIVKARPKWDKLSNKMITDKPLEVFGPWQIQDYEPPTAENGIVPRNAYGNVELFKESMLPKGTVHIKLPALNRVAKKLNIDCAPAMTGFDFNGGYTHPVFDGFVVCKEFEEIITEAWVKDQEELEKREREKIETRVYGNWRRLIKGLFIKERLKAKYGFEEPSTSDNKKRKGPRFVTSKKV
ncbi:DNA repair protein complementing XP-C cells homolog isoform X1 [Pieris napi]|uniref:DNA repair protein complementing XP-C cells homolog isoform X1 n=2 Tax=Pieris napi TaxID=78633 RepID=UPI001FBA1807|nr:DNA repair protein complementing XP-C cells homolog isoform X1 [Pieris napi]